MTNQIICGDCIEQMKLLEENSVDAIITDPPYGLEFMGKEWDRLTSSGFSSGEFKGFRLPAHSGTKRNVKCPECNKWIYDHHPRQCKCGGVERLKSLKQKEFHYLWASECLRVLKPGGFLLSFGGTRTYHRMTCGIEDAGFEIRDTIMWLYGSGFPKSLNIGKQIDKMNERFYDKDFYNYLNEKRKEKGITLKKINQECGYSDAGGGMSSYWLGVKTEGHFHGLPSKKDYRILKELLELDNRFDELINKTEAEREILEKKWRTPSNKPEFSTQWGFGAKTDGHYNITKPNLPEAKEWEGWGTALKPACEPIVVARKPLSEKNVALNVLKHGTGGLNIDACRIEGEPWKPNKAPGLGSVKFFTEGENKVIDKIPHDKGRFPANIILDEEAGKMLDEQSGDTSQGHWSKSKVTGYGEFGGGKQEYFGKGEYAQDKGGASRFFYCPKASKSERNFGCDEFPNKQKCPMSKESRIGECINASKGMERFETICKNNHPTVKPIALMEYLIKLISKKDAVILDPFLGSGTTAIACLKLNRKFIGIEKEEEYVKIAEARIKPFLEQTKL